MPIGGRFFSRRPFCHNTPMSDSQEGFVRTEEGMVYGPADVAALCAWAKDGHIKPSCFVSSDRMAALEAAAQRELARERATAAASDAGRARRLRRRRRERRRQGPAAGAGAACAGGRGGDSKGVKCGSAWHFR